ncbi:hypothetical protein [Frankia sp. AgKG'84/4]|uniref:hypothetical protein n=1 Tax=Frankia sp. AgKG'84/4 TaxID=573490 RepID=UPI00202A20C9|nr:hypothetical protein [Frankia sp. AgKG'84/4]MCL9793284.1 hypothetical protein [Frankia sp. AgKG'84/4]
MTADTTDMNAHDATRILTALVGGPLSAPDIVDRTGIARTRLRPMLNELAGTGRIAPRHPVPTPGRPGRRPVLWELVATTNMDSPEPAGATAQAIDIPAPKPTPDAANGDRTGPADGEPLDAQDPAPAPDTPDPDLVIGEVDGPAEHGLRDETSPAPSAGACTPTPDPGAVTAHEQDPADPDLDDEGDQPTATPPLDPQRATGPAHPDGPDDAASLASTGTDAGPTAAPVSADTTNPDPDSPAVGEDPHAEDEPAPAAPLEDDAGAVEVDTATPADEQSLDASDTPPGQVGVAADGAVPGEVPVCAALACPLAACPVRTGTPAPPSRARSRDRGGATKSAPALNASGSVRLAPGALGRLVEELLVGNPEAQLTAGEIARELGRSSGAVTAAMPKLISSGKAIQVDPGGRPARYQTAAKA